MISLSREVQRVWERTNFGYRFGENLPGTSFGYGIENAGLSAEALLHSLAEAGLSNAGDRYCGGSDNAYRRQGNAAIVGCEDSTETGRPRFIALPLMRLFCRLAIAGVAKRIV
jgi:hypothetical protein